MTLAASTARKTIAASCIPETRPVYRLSVQQYHRKIETGILTAKDRVELLQGRLIPKMSRNSPHGSSITRINRRLVRVLPDNWVLRVQSAVTLQDSEPEPDFAIARGPEERYDRRKPVPRDLAVLMEVADSSLLEDRKSKGQPYAQARIPACWIINLVEARVEVLTQPRGGKSPGYRQRQDYGIDDLVPLILGGNVIALIPVRDLLPR